MATWRWAQGDDGRELRSNFIPKSDGSDYDDSIVPPTFTEIRNTIENKITVDLHKRFILIAIGRLGSDGREISGDASKPESTFTLIQDAQRGGSYYERWQRIFNAHTPFKHIHTVIIRPL